MHKRPNLPRIQDRVVARIQRAFPKQSVYLLIVGASREKVEGSEERCEAYAQTGQVVFSDLHRCECDGLTESY